MGWVDEARTGANIAANVSTGGGYGAAKAAVQGDTKGAATSLATGGLNSIPGVQKGIDKVAADIGAANPFKKAGVPELPTITAPAQVAGTTLTGQTITPQAAAQAAQVASIGGPQAATIAGMPQDGRNSQLALLSQLQNQANGVGPSIAEMQMRQGNDQAIASQFALANSGHGNPAALRGAMNNAASLQGSIGQQAAMLRLQEQQQAQGLLGNVAGQMQGQDFNLANANAGFQQQANMGGYQGNLQSALQNAQNQQTAYGQTYQGNLQTALQNAKNIQDANLATAQMGLDASKTNVMSDLEKQKLIQQGALGQADLAQKATTSQNALMGNSLAAMGPLLSGLAAMSDRAAKKDIESGEPAVREFLDKLGAHEYAYKDESNGKGRRVSPMAQELLQSTIGKSMVKETSKGLMVDYGAGFGALLAAQASLNKRLAAIETKKAS